MRFIIRGFFGLFLAGMTAALILAAVTVLLSAIKQSQSDGGDARQAQERIFTVNVATVHPIRAIPVIDTFGEVISGRILELRAASGGALVQMAGNFKEGGVVYKDTLLFQTDPATASANAQLSQASLDEAEVELNEAIEAVTLAKDELLAAKHQYELRQQVLKRQTSLRVRGIGTETALETAALAGSAAKQVVLAKRQALANAKARINRAKISLSRSNINFNEAARILAETSVIAEFDGVLSEVTGDLGALVNSGERMALLIDPNALEVSFRVSNSEFNHMIRDGLNLSLAKVFVSIDGSDKAISATVDRVSAAVGVGQTGRELYASLDPVEIATVRPGDFVTVRLEEPALDNVAVLPATAASATGDVLVLGKGDRLEVLNVEILRKRGNEIIVAIGGLAGREIILERAPQLGAGIKVEPRRSNKGLSKEQTTSE